MIATVQKNTSYESTTADNFYQKNVHHHHNNNNNKLLVLLQRGKPSVLRRLSLKSFPSQSKFKSEHLVPSFNFKIVILCLMWYLTSVMSNNSTKSILKQFKYPITLTEFQFILTQFFCILTIIILKKNTNNNGILQRFPKGTFPDSTSIRKFIKPTRQIISVTLPMGGFQFIGHITSHKATSIIPVSLVHTIKLLSPLTTVLIYKLVFNKQFSLQTYLTLIPLVVGVMLSCLKPNTSIIIESYGKGCFFAFLSMIIFVSQNMFAKDILTTRSSLLPKTDDDLINNEKTPKLDKLTILYWCSTFGFCLTLPIYIISELSSESLSLTQLDLGIAYLLFFNGLSHFLQSLMAFQILGLISPVNYSIANILKRICVILASIVYERQSVNGIQSVGLILTMFGVYSYDKWGKNK